ncbi:H-type small acid-soluble spore protein [Alkalibacillus filiformis]|uniref:Small, acid-soluble spore protein H n=1 Tax=Alkalibacillus filiformis TaxID=200990 RepID=A0ABU0DSS0_9BACI|nr:H-type small acid-soluble spore protein [Alkalibacillus filiformis]MDQ0351479.1 H-type small acid-soluble spore protein [Alkalibacillus filiformis]
MNLMRAKEIKDDPNMKNVVYNGKYVYIEDVNDEKQKAIIHYLKESGKEFEVDVTELKEE